MLFFWTRLFYLSVLFSGLSGMLYAQPVIQWDKTVGGEDREEISDILLTSDGGYLLAGTSLSDLGGDKKSDGRGQRDYWVVKMSADRKIQWDRTFGGNSYDQLKSVVKTSDGGYLLGGHSNSNGGDKTTPSRGQIDYWIVKISANGTKQWDKTFGSPTDELFGSIVPTANGEFTLTGSTSKQTVDETGFPILEYDLWLVHIDAKGNKLWEKTIDRPDNEFAESVVRNPDGTLMLTATAYSWKPSNGSSYRVDQTWLLKLTATGNIIWNKYFGKGQTCRTSRIIATSDGGYAMSMFTTGADYWVTKLDKDGKLQWENFFRAVYYDEPFAIRETELGGFVVGGYSDSYASNDKSENPKGDEYYEDIWLVGMSSSGQKQWDKTIGGYGNDFLANMISTPDGGYILAGHASESGGDKTEESRGSTDFWMVKIAPEAVLPVTLKSFSAVIESGTSLLTWSSTSETHSDHFEVQHSRDGRTWEVITTINAAGESDHLQTYQYVHTSPASGSDNFYRLKMVDTDGSFTYSKIQLLRYETNVSLNVYPNPVTESLILNVPDWTKVRSVRILNTQGKIVYQSRKKPVDMIDTKNLHPGLYVVEINLANGSATTKKFVVERP